jgi:AraC-like DNA-binding protein
MFILYIIRRIFAMDLLCEERPSDSPYIERILQSQNDFAGPFIAMADVRSALVVTRYRGQTTLTVRGPETNATEAHALAESEILGIVFKPGVFLANLPPDMVMRRRGLTLPEANHNRFWLHGSAWQYPGYENAEQFVNRLVKEGLLVQDPIVNAALQGQPLESSLRTVGRHFRQATGLTHGLLFQIERARSAISLLKQGIPIADVAYRVGYFDQPHLTRSMNRFIGLTPSQIANEGRIERLSFLYKTDRLRSVTIGAYELLPEEGQDEKNQESCGGLEGWYENRV